MNMIIGTLITYIVYRLAKKVYQKWSFPLLNPLLVSPIVLIGFISLADIPAVSYLNDTKWITNMLGPATVAFAIPIYKHFYLLKKYIGNILISITCGTFVAIVTSFALAFFGQLPLDLLLSLLPRSITTPIAIEMSESIGGLPALTTVFVIVTGMSGGIIGPSIIKWFSIQSPVARGLALGMGAHGSGTAAAMEYGEKEATFSTIALIFAAWITLIWGNSLIPALMLMIK
ncbi:LrgB family protein [Bacillus benzoevorans]|uniref:Putative murein hydrolase (TIGR00659 family) n=1 Tax=Bacillus benzoevorans TaxID=1456 RepID=A0A7X0HT69_9BACI|nr:LrgB family protein [Bacillus benzoevorans]MBB6446409.1 putative murein hydrolase (TIGR00659 family) [Bacillus benzoevorans]